ncbi:MAG: SCO family protein [Sphingobacteriaceae bacterium]|nr:SCO family protein [Sphingobacteriaceae bacterium]
MNKKLNKAWLLALLPLVFFAWFFLSKTKETPLRKLAYYGPKNYGDIEDTVYHLIPDFEFTDQDNKKVTKSTLANKVYITEYFFTTCQSICPVMNKNLEKVYAEFKKRDDFLILSHTVDPETDSVPVLKNYANAHGVNDEKWKFVTGDKKALYDVARKGYLLNAEEGNGGPEDFIHTQNFALIDKDFHIRGYYDGTDVAEIERLIQETHLLLQEYDTKK